MSDQPDVPMIDPSQGWGGKLGDWFKQHWTTTIIFVIIAFLIWGIYSNYTAENKTAENENNENITNTENTNESDNQNIAENTNEAEAANEESSEETQETNNNTAENNASTVTVSSEKITVATTKGDGMTHLARKALKQYLENNPDSQLTKEHKIFVEDYMRKKVPYSSLQIGDSKDFSINLIQEAINASKKLTDNQLNNLKKYSSRVSNL